MKEHHLKIAYICNFSHPVKEGVWNNVYNTAKYMIQKGHEVHVFSSNINPSGKNSGSEEKFEGMHIHRFPVKFKIGMYGLFWDFEKELEKIKPDIVHTHVYRNPHSHKALKVAQKLGIPCFLTTHAPFVEKKLRSIGANFFVWFYDIFYGRKTLNSYNKVIAITKWEIPFLLRLGCKKEKIAYIPNGVLKDFLNVKLYKKRNNQAIYLGRISNIKNTQIIADVAQSFPEIKFKLIGPVEKGYSLEVKSKNVEVVNKIFNRKEQINLLKESDIYILPSKREGSPQTLLEAMAAGKLVLSSATQGGKELVDNGKTGFLFHIDNEQELKEKLKYCFENYDKLFYVRKNARDFASGFLWQDLTKKIEKLYKRRL